MDQNSNKEAKSQPNEKNGMKKFPEDPENWNPIQLLNQMKPGIQYIETQISLCPSIFHVSFKTGDLFFLGQGSLKKEAKMNCCIAAIKYFYGFDFHAIEDDYSFTKK
ncbi:uncharacterized protein LOC111037437 isoform X2 [Myzus persicae]|uniref:uncharacterized protein LOC111037437 isoform X2 n=1 Tax=Myzus persicae TaxID=13164 RepID=UPI000B9315E9|nr:uncharacterized protein LOC111037437 isoform X2 [Myzus persicae]